MNCNFKNVKVDGSNCESDFAGVGDSVFFFKASDLSSIPTNEDFDEDSNCYAAETFASLEGKLYRVDIKQNSGKVETSKSENGDGYTHTGTFVVEKNLDKFAVLARALGLVDFGAFISDNKGKYHVLYNPYKRTQFGNSFTTGDTFDSEHGHTVTLTSAPMEFPSVKWSPGAGVNLNDWCADEDAERVSTPTISPASWSEGASLDVTISCATDGATIYYTTDGSAPTTASSVYSSAISISATTTIKAIAVKSSMQNSAVATRTYTKP